MSAPPEGAPGMFRCAKPGLISGMFDQAGLKNISETEVSGKMNCDNAEQYNQHSDDWVYIVVNQDGPTCNGHDSAS